MELPDATSYSQKWLQVLLGSTCSTCRLKLFKFGIQLLSSFEMSEMSQFEEDDNSRGFAALDSVFSIPSGHSFAIRIKHATRLEARVEQPAQLAVLDLVRAMSAMCIYSKIFTSTFTRKRYIQRKQQRF